MGANGGEVTVGDRKWEGGGAGSGRVLLQPNAGEHPEFLLLTSLLYGFCVFFTHSSGSFYHRCIFCSLRSLRSGCQQIAFLTVCSLHFQGCLGLPDHSPGLPLHLFLTKPHTFQPTGPLTDAGAQCTHPALTPPPWPLILFVRHHKSPRV